MTNLGGDTAEKVFGSDNLFSRNNSDMSNKSGQQTEVEIKVDIIVVEINNDKDNPVG